MRDMNEGELHALYDKGCCPHCGSREYLPGPRGGMMCNIRCANCPMELNIFESGALRVGQVLVEPPGYTPPQDPGRGKDSGAVPRTLLERLGQQWRQFWRGDHQTG